MTVHFAARFALACALLLAPALASAVSYSVKPLTGVAVTADERTAVEALITSAVAKYSRSAPAEIEDSDHASLAASLVKLGSAYSLTLTKTKPNGSAFTQQTRATSVEELDVATDRLVRAVLADVAIDQDARLGDVTEQEASRQLRQTDVTRQWVFGLGPVVGSGFDANDPGISWALGYTFGLSPEFSARAGLDFGSFDRGEKTFWDVNLGGDYFLTEIYPGTFVTVEFGYGRARDVTGFALGGGVGYRFARTSKVNMGITLKYVSWTASDELRGRPSVGLATLALYF